MMSMTRWVPLLAALAVATVACGDGGGHGGAQAQTEEGVLVAVEAATEGAFRGNAGAVLDFLNKECRDSIDEQEVRQTLLLVRAFFGDAFEGFALDDIEVRANVVSFDEDTAQVDVTYEAPDGSDLDTLGFSSETITVVYEDGKWVDSGCDFGDTGAAEADALEEQLAALGYEATRDDPIPRGVAAPVGAGFVVSVDALDPDAAAALEESGGFISDPEPGTQFVLVSMTVGFDEPDEPRSVSNLSGQIIGGSNSVGIDNYGCGSFPTQLSNRAVNLFEGGVVSGDMCFAVPTEDVGGMLLSLTGDYGDRQIIFDPTAVADSPVPVTGATGPQPDARFTAQREAPAALGEPVEVGNGWTVTVRGVDFDATDVLTEGDSNDPPPSGYVYTLVDLELAYDGDEQSDSGFSVDLDVVGDSNVSGDRNCDVFDIPDELDRFADVFKGGAVSGNKCFLVAESDLDSLVMFASADFFGDSGFVLALR